MRTWGRTGGWIQSYLQVNDNCIHVNIMFRDKFQFLSRQLLDLHYWCDFVFQIKLLEPTDTGSVCSGRVCGFSCCLQPAMHHLLLGPFPNPLCSSFLVTRLWNPFHCWLNQRAKTWKLYSVQHLLYIYNLLRQSSSNYLKSLVSSSANSQSIFTPRT